jgi:dolichol-phosphate mannosyltransferase
MRIELSVIIPAYMEEENLRILLPRISRVLGKIGCVFECIIVDSNERLDDTELVCIENNFKYVSREGTDSYGDAVRTGIKFAKGKYIIFMDADGSHSPEFIQDLYKKRDFADVIIASRYIRQGNSDNSLILKAMSRALNISYSLVFGINAKDISNSFKLYNADVFNKINLVSSNFDIIQEILIKARRNKVSLSILEVPYTFKQRMFGRTKRNLLLFMLGYFITMIKLRLSR